MTTGRKYTISTGISYLLALPLVPILNYYFPSGPCNIGLGFLWFFLLLLASLISFIICGARRLRGKKNLTGPTIVHGAAFLTLIILGHYNLL